MYLLYYIELSVQKVHDDVTIGQLLFGSLGCSCFEFVWSLFFCIFYSGRVVESDTWYGPLAIFALVASTGLYICGEDKSHAGTYPAFLFLLAWLHYHTSFIISCIVHAHTLVSFFEYMLVHPDPLPSSTLRVSSLFVVLHFSC